jgi:hypothetical protein
MSAQRASRRLDGGRPGTLTFSVVGASCRSTQSAAAQATSTAVSQYHRSPGPRLTARPSRPKVRAVSTAPTVPEWMIDVPVLMPALMPDTTRSGSDPNAPRAAAITASPGGPFRE